MTEHVHEHPPTRLTTAVLADDDPTLPEREILTPLGKARLRNASLESKGYRYSFSKNCDDKLVEIVYLRDNGTTGTIIADIDSLFDTELTVKDEKPVCQVTFKLIKKATNPVNIYRADVPISSISDGLVGNIMRGLLDYFLEKVYGRGKSV